MDYGPSTMDYRLALLTTFRGGKNQFNYICGRLLKGPDLLIIHY